MSAEVLQPSNIDPIPIKPEIGQAVDSAQLQRMAGETALTTLEYFAASHTSAQADGASRGTATMPPGGDHVPMDRDRR